MFAIVKIAGQQFKVSPGQNLFVPHLPGKQGDEIEFSEVLLHDDNGKVSVGSDVNVKIKAEILNELVKGEKVIAFKMKRRKGFRKKHGHRTQYTHIKVTGIA
jgi:large subunit ribosomal protein L21